VSDYRRFLASAAPAEEVVLPYFGGPFVEATDRRLRLTGPPGDAGFWRFAVRGRRAEPVGPADPPDLTGLPAVRGYALDGYLVGAGGQAERFAIGPLDEPLRFAPVVGRRWPTGEVLFDMLDFESGVEDAVRSAYERRRPVRGISGVPSALRAAYGYAVLLRVAAEAGVPARPAEARAHLAALADEGDPAAHRLLGAMRAARTAAAPGRRAGVAARLDARVADRAEERAAAALYAARAAVRDFRWLDGGLLEVRYDCEGEYFVSIVEGQSLRVVDAGICLDEHDRELTLESLPGVLREAIRTGQLHLTAW
jgi:hypothetical protein